jgi:hypothetical protein
MNVPDDARVAYLFSNAARAVSAVTLLPNGRDLPDDMGEWSFERMFILGVQEVLPVNVSPEPMLRGLKLRGYFIWPTENIEPFGTSQ